MLRTTSFSSRAGSIFSIMHTIVLLAIEIWLVIQTGVFSHIVRFSFLLFDITLALLLIDWVIIAIHEVGHLIAGLLSRQQLAFFFIGNLLWFNTEVGLKSTRIDRRARRGAGGVVSVTPVSTENLVLQRIIVIAGGPFTTLVTGVITTLIFFNIDVLAPLPAFILEAVMNFHSKKAIV